MALCMLINCDARNISNTNRLYPPRLLADVPRPHRSLQIMSTFVWRKILPWRDSHRYSAMSRWRFIVTGTLIRKLHKWVFPPASWVVILCSDWSQMNLITALRLIIQYETWCGRKIGTWNNVFFNYINPTGSVAISKNPLRGLRVSLSVRSSSAEKGFDPASIHTRKGMQWQWVELELGRSGRTYGRRSPRVHFGCAEWSGCWRGKWCFFTF